MTNFMELVVGQPRKTPSSPPPLPSFLSELFPLSSLALSIFIQVSTEPNLGIYIYLKNTLEEGNRLSL